MKLFLLLDESRDKILGAGYTADDARDTAWTWPENTVDVYRLPVVCAEVDVNNLDEVTAHTPWREINEMPYFLVQVEYIGPDRDKWRDVRNSIFRVQRYPECGNLSKKAILSGWCGSTNDRSTYAIGVYDTAEAAVAEIRRRVQEEFGSSYEPYAWDQGEIEAMYGADDMMVFNSSPYEATLSADWALTNPPKAPDEFAAWGIYPSTTDEEVCELAEELKYRTFKETGCLLYADEILFSLREDCIYRLLADAEDHHDSHVQAADWYASPNASIHLGVSPSSSDEELSRIVRESEETLLRQGYVLVGMTHLVYKLRDDLKANSIH